MSKWIYMLVFAMLFAVKVVKAQEPVWDRAALLLGDTTELTADEREMLLWMNMARTNPPAFWKMVFGEGQDMFNPENQTVRAVSYFEKRGNKTVKISLELTFYPDEEDFIPAFNELKAYMLSLEPRQPLLALKTLKPGMQAHLAYLDELGKLSHRGRGGSTHHERIRAHEPRAAATAENLLYRIHSPYEALMSLLLDDGVSSRGHRNNIMNETLTHVYVGKYKDYWGQAFCNLKR